MSTDRRDIFRYFRDPVYLALLSLVLYLVLLFALGLMYWSGNASVERSPWILAAAVTLLYTIFNAVFLLFSKKLRTYWQRSMYSYMGLLLATGALAWMISGQSLKDTGNFRSIIIVLILSYIIFLLIATTVRGVVKFSQKQDEQKLARDQPGKYDQKQKP